MDFTGKMGDDLMDFFNVRKEFPKVYLKVSNIFVSQLFKFLSVGSSNYGPS